MATEKNKAETKEETIDSNLETKAEETNTSNDEDKTEKKKKIKSRISTGLIVIVCAFICFICFRYKVRYIASGSMEPTYEIGELVLIDPEAYKQEDPKVDDIAMYKYGEREVIHRVTAYDNSSTIPTCTFKGDSNSAEDFIPIPVTNIEGKAVWSTDLFAPIIRRIFNLSNL